MKTRDVKRVIISIVLIFNMVFGIAIQPVAAYVENGKSGIETDFEEAEKTDRFIIKYKDEKKEEGKEAVKEIVGEKLKSMEEVVSDDSSVEESENMDMETLSTVMLAVSKFKKGNKSKHQIDVLVTNEEVDQKQMIKEFEREKSIEYIQPDYKISLSSNDPYFKEQWPIVGGNRTVSESVYSHINLIPAWDKTRGEGVVVGVIDTGIDIEHEELSKNIWINENEIPGNGIDDDENGYIDDVNGWDFTSGSKEVHNANSDREDEHGTHVAGIIAAQKDNEKGISGVAPKSKLMVLKAFDGKDAYTSDIIKAIDYADKMGAKIINCSWMEKRRNDALKEAMEGRDMLFLFASGNDGMDLDEEESFFDNYNDNNIMVVGSLDYDNRISYFSNYGENTVDLFAYGEEITSTFPQNAYGVKGGTSMAVAFVSGQASLLMSEYPEMDIDEVKKLMIDSSDWIYKSSSEKDYVKRINIGDSIEKITGKRHEKPNGDTVTDEVYKETVVEEVYKSTVTDEIYGNDNYLPFAVEILFGIDKFSDSSAEDMKIVASYYGVEAYELLSLEKKGYSIIDSLNIVVMAKEYGFTVEEMERLKHIYEDDRELINQLHGLHMFIDTYHVDPYKVDIFKKKLLEGKSLDEILGSGSIELAEVYEYDPEIKYDKYLASPFEQASYGGESISKNSGNLKYSVPLVNIPGRNGLDLNVSINYNSSEAQFYEKYCNYDMKTCCANVFYSAKAEIIPYDEEMSSYEGWEEDFIKKEGVPFISENLSENQEPCENLNEAYKFTEELRKKSNQHFEYVGESNPIAISYEEMRKYKEKNPNIYDVEKYSFTCLKRFDSTGYDGIDKYAVKLKYTIEDITYKRPVKVRDGEYNEYTEKTYNQKENNMPVGWSFGFPSIETDRLGKKNSKYFHFGNGSMYEVEMTGDEDDSNLKKYKLKDLKFEETDKVFPENGAVAKYVMTYANKTKEYFDSKGRLIYTVDRYGNRIRYDYDRNSRIPEEITDSINRKTRIDFDEEYTTIIKPDNQKIGISMSRAKSKIKDYEDNDYFLSYIQFEDKNKIIFDYDFVVGNFNFFSKNENELYYKEGKERSPETNIYANLKTVIYPNKLKTEYKYEKTIGNLGKDGLYEFYRIDKRQDVDDGGKSYNRFTYIYGEDEKRYPLDVDENENKTNLIETKNFIKADITKDDISERTGSIVVGETESWKGRRHFYTEHGMFIKINDDVFDRIPDNSKIMRADISLWAAHKGNREMKVGTFLVESKYGEGRVRSKYFSKDHPIFVRIMDGKRVFKWNITRVADRWNNGRTPNHGVYMFDMDGKYVKDEGSSEWFSFDDGQVEIYYTSPAKKSSNYTGYPGRQDPQRLHRYEYKTTIERDLGDKKALQTIYYYNGDHLLEKVETNKINKEEITGEKTISYKKSLDKKLDETTYEYDLRDLVIEKNVKSYTGNRYSESSVSFIYDDYGNVKKSVDELGHATTYTYDDKYHQMKNMEKMMDKNKKMKVEYGINHSNGNIDWMKQYTGGKAITTSYGYDKFGNLTRQSTDTGENKKLEYTYIYDSKYKNAYLTSTIVNVTDHNKKKTTIKSHTSYDYHTGRKTEEYVEPKNNKTKYQYDIMGRPTKYVNPDGTDVDITYDPEMKYTIVTYQDGYKVKNTYDMFGNVVSVEECTIINDRWTWRNLRTNEYDDYGRLILTKDSKNGPTSYKYDEYSRIVKAVSPNNTYIEVKYDAASRKVTLVDQERNSLSYYYDKLGNCIKTEDHLKHSTSSEYDYAGNLKKVIDKNGHPTSYYYDELSRLTSVVNALGEKTQYEYNNLGNITKTIFADGKFVTKEYDELGRVIKSTDQAKKTSYVKYDELGNVISSTDKMNVATSMTYDNMNRIKTLGTPNDKRRYEYYHDSGNLKTLADKNGTTSYDYYKDDKLKKETDVFGKSIQYQYDSNGNRTNIKDPWNLNVSYTYDKLNRLDFVKVDGRTANYDYYKDGMIKSLTYPKLKNGAVLKTNFKYDAKNRVQEVKNQIGSKVISSFTYRYDKVGNITDIQSNFKKQTYKYDKLDRVEITKDDSFGQITFGYNKTGNRTSASGDVDHLNEFIPGEFKYDDFNRVIQFKNGSKVANYKYNPSGIRIEKQVGSEITRYHVSSGGLVIAESDKNGRAKAQIIWGHKPLMRKVNGKYYYYVYNGHGDVVQMLAEDGKIVNEYEYDEWGNILKQRETIRNDIKYSGEYYDSESGLYYLRARYYDPTIGRFISRDSYEGSVTNPLSLNLYTYCHNNPVNNMDSSGHCLETVADIVSAGYSGYQLFKDPSWANLGYFAWDVGAIVVAGAPGSYVTKGGKIVDAVDDVSDAAKLYLKTSDEVSDVAKIYHKADDAVEVATKGMSGEWVDINRHMSDLSRKYQTQITGTTQEFLQNGVHFDGVANGRLLEAKADYTSFVDKKTGSFFGWFKGKDGLVSEATRQLNASNGLEVDWYFMDEVSMNATKELFAENGIEGINFVLESLK